jgi:hypothetical protein
MKGEEEFARELAKQLPVKAMYEDAAAPAAKQAGQLFQDLVKALQLALAPVQLLAALQDRIEGFLTLLSAVFRKQTAFRRLHKLLVRCSKAFAMNQRALQSTRCSRSF